MMNADAPTPGCKCRYCSMPALDRLRDNVLLGETAKGLSIKAAETVGAKIAAMTERELDGLSMQLNGAVTLGTAMNNRLVVLAAEAGIALVFPLMQQRYKQLLAEEEAKAAKAAGGGA